MPTCSEIVENGCSQSVAKDWNYCIKCGALLTKLEIVDGQLTANPSAQLDLELVKSGQSNLPVQLEAQIVDSEGSNFRLVNTYPASITRERTGIRVQYDPPQSSNEISFTLRYRATGAPRQNGSRWATSEFGQWKTKVFRLSPIIQGALEIVPQALVFWGNQNRRKIELRNGGSPITLGQAQLPSGYRLTDQNREPVSVAGHIVAKGAPATFFLERTNLTAPGGKVVFRDDQLTDVGPPLEILSIPDQGIVERPKFVFGIDFGTSNTSVVARHVKTGTVTMLEYPDSESAKFFYEPDLCRFPTAILINGNDPSDLRYGFDAVANFLPTRGDVLVTELKSLLRHETEPYTSLNPELTVDGILTWYFKKLKQDFVDPFRKAVLGDVESTDLYVFSLPVLDYGTDQPLQYEMQKSRTLAAARAAGFGDGLNVRTVHEPVAAALKMLKDINSGDESIRCKAGDQMVVFDSGGGTTDVAIFELAFEEGKYVMDKIAQVGLHRVTVNDQVIERHFGGAVITQDLGYIVCEYYMSKKGLTIRNYLNEIEKADYESFDEVYGWSQEGYLYQRTPSFEEYWVAETRQRRELAWFKRFVSLYYRVEETKRRLGHGEEGPLPLDPRINQLMTAEGFEEEDLPEVSHEDLQAVLENHLPILFESIRADIRQRVASGPVKVLFIMGGNSNLPQVRSGIRPALNPEVMPDISEDVRKHAVALGTVESYEPNAAVAPYRLRLVNRSTGAVLFDASPEQIQKGFKRDVDYRLPPSAKLPIDIYIGISEPNKLAQSISLQNETDEQRLCTYRVAYDEKAVSILDLTEETVPKERFIYEV